MRGAEDSSSSSPQRAGEGHAGKFGEGLDVDLFDRGRLSLRGSRAARAYAWLHGLDPDPEFVEDGGKGSSLGASTVQTGGKLSSL